MDVLDPTNNHLSFPVSVSLNSINPRSYTLFAASRSDLPVMLLTSHSALYSTFSGVCAPTSRSTISRRFKRDRKERRYTLMREPLLSICYCSVR